MAQLATSIAIASNAGFHGNQKGLDKWVETLTGSKPGRGRGSSRNIREFIKQLETTGKVAVRGTNRR